MPLFAPNASTNPINPPRPGDKKIALMGFHGGLNLKPSPLHVAEGQLTEIRNYRIVGSTAQTQFGSSVLGGDLVATSPTSAPALLLFNFLNAAGTNNIVAVNSQRPYVYNAGGNSWDNLSGGADVFTGTDTDAWSDCVAASDAAPGTLDATLNLHVITNGIDAPRCWDGDTTDQYTVVNANMPVCRYVAFFANRVFAAHIGGNSTRVQWCVNGNITDWIGYGSGTLDRAGSGGYITGLRELRGNGILYFNNAIETITPIGQTANTPVQFNQSPGPGLGLLAPRSLKSLPSGEHIFLGSDFNVYIFDGSTPRPIGNDIAEDIRKRLNPSRVRNVCAMVVARDREYWLAIPQAADATFASIVYIYNYEQNTWHRFFSPESITELADATDPASVVTIGGLAGTIGSLSGTIGTLSGFPGASTKALFGLQSGSTNRVHQANYGSVQFGISATSIAGWIDTPASDYGSPGLRKTITRVKIKYQDSSQVAGRLFLVGLHNGQELNLYTTETAELARLGDGTIKEAVADLFYSGDSFGIRVQPLHTGVATPEAFIVHGIEAHMLLGGNTF